MDYNSLPIYRFGTLNIGRLNAEAFKSKNVKNLAYPPMALKAFLKLFCIMLSLSSAFIKRSQSPCSKIISSFSNFINPNSFRVIRPVALWHRYKTELSSSSTGGKGRGRKRDSNQDGSQGNERGAINNDFFDDLIKHVHGKNFKAAMESYECLKVAGYPTKPNTFNSLLSVCCKAEHLPAALRLFDDMKGVNSGKRSEQAYLALIRCYSAAGEIDMALSLVAEMESLSLEPRLRTYHPIFEAICENGDVEHALELMKTICSENIIPKSEHLELLIGTAARSGQLKNPSVRESLDGIIFSLSSELLGMQIDEMQRLTAALATLTVDQVREQGVLVENIAAIQGEIVENNFETTGEAMAVSNEYLFPSTYFTDTLPVPSSIDAAVPITSSNTSTSMTTYVEKYKLAEPGMHTCSARIVDVYNESGCCPNCGVKLKQLTLTEEERTRVRTALGEMVTSQSPGQFKSLQLFAEWLQKQPEEFTYIVDGANVAYHKQNFEDGHFSYKQIDTVVNLLQQRGEKILVLIPYPYARRIIPNNTKHKKAKRITYLTQDDIEILERWESQGMLYVVAQWANDDWYWMYATVNENRKKMAYVVTNDLMRDHRIAFLEPRPFVRWRTTQVIHFDFVQTSVQPSEKSIREDIQASASNVSEAVLIEPGEREFPTPSSALSDTTF